MRRITISVEDALADAFDGLVERKGYLNRSEAFRDLLRRVYGEEDLVGPKAQWCVATVSYLFDHHEPSPEVKVRKKRGKSIYRLTRCRMS
jgi:CopG family nickel-responsive transcriptional regulator